MNPKPPSAPIVPAEGEELSPLTAVELDDVPEAERPALDTKKPGHRFTRMMELFCHYYEGEAKGFASRAARMAGYLPNGNPHSMRKLGSALLKNPHVQARIRELREERLLKPSIATRTELREKLTDLARLPVDKYVNHRAVVDSARTLLELEGDFIPEKIVDNRIAEFVTHLHRRMERIDKAAAQLMLSEAKTLLEFGDVMDAQGDVA